MIQNECSHNWIESNDYPSYGGGSIQSMYQCSKCNKQLPANEVFQLEALDHLRGFQKYIAIIAVIISFLALLISIFRK